MRNGFREASPDYLSQGHCKLASPSAVLAARQASGASCKCPMPAGDPAVANTPMPACGIAARMILRLVAHATGCASERLVASDRGTGSEARSRQMAMYLIHTSLSVPYNDVATMFRRDRTTVAHACRTIEDMRDTPAFDDMIGELEKTIELMASMAGSVGSQEVRNGQA
ncbi:MAG: helix-turn-helix domain-containing protein [Nitratireductor sp.]